MPRDTAPILTPEAITAAGEALYGQSFAGPLSRDLGHKEDRTVRNWLAGIGPRHPEDVQRALVLLLRERRADIDRVLKRLG